MERQRIHPPSESTAIFIRDWLLKHKMDYPYSMWKAWRDHLKRLQMKAPQQTSFRKYIYTLTRAQLLRRIPAQIKQDKEWANLKPFPRSYYELIPKNIDNEELWRNPQVAVWGEKMRWGKRRYRKRILHLTPLPRGRPPKPRRKTVLP